MANMQSPIGSVVETFQLVAAASERFNRRARNMIVNSIGANDNCMNDVEARHCDFLRRRRRRPRRQRCAGSLAKAARGGNRVILAYVGGAQRDGR